MLNLGLSLGIGYEHTGYAQGEVVSPMVMIWFNGVPLLFNGDYITYL